MSILLYLTGIISAVYPYGTRFLPCCCYSISCVLLWTQAAAFRVLPHAVLLAVGVWSAVTVTPVSALDVKTRHGSLRQLQGSSGLPPPTAGLNLFVRDTGPGLDTGCSFNDLTITLPVGTINPLATGAFLIMPAFDVDEPDEQDQVKLNGNTLDLLKGANGKW